MELQSGVWCCTLVTLLVLPVFSGRGRPHVKIAIRGGKRRQSILVGIESGLLSEHTFPAIIGAEIRTMHEARFW